jgi:NAD(P)-dependent dehydrogenase (short-subunit alcohol dehydrogenase family)
MKLNNKISVVVGAGNGLGRATALLFASEGAKVALVDHDTAVLAPIAIEIARIGGTAITIAADVSQAEEVKAMVERTVAELGLPSVLFNNAGVVSQENGPLTEVSEDAFDRVVSINFKGAWLAIKYVVPYMIQAGGGSIINTSAASSSMAGNSIGYVGAEAAVASMTRVAAVEFAEHGIRVNSFCPGAVRDPAPAGEPGVQCSKGERYDDTLQSTVSLLRRFGEPEEMAKTVLFLACDDSSFTTGASFLADGGWTAKRSYNGAVPVLA